MLDDIHKRFAELAEIGRQRLFTDEELFKIGLMAEESAAKIEPAPPMDEEGQLKLTHPLLQFWQVLAKQPAAVENIKAMHKRVAMPLIAVCRKIP